MKFTSGRWEGGESEDSYSGDQLSDVNNSNQLTGGGGGGGSIVMVVVVQMEGVAAAWTWPDKVTTPLAASQQLVSESPSDNQYTRAPTHAHSSCPERVGGLGGVIGVLFRSQIILRRVCSPFR